MYCTHVLRSRKHERCFKTRAAAVKFCKTSANRGRCCEVYRKRGR